MSDRPCKPCPLAHSGACELWICSDCGMITINLGSVILRVQQNRFREVANTIQEALQNLRCYKTPSNKSYSGDKSFKVN